MSEEAPAPSTHSKKVTVLLNQANPHNAPDTPTTSNDGHTDDGTTTPFKLVDNDVVVVKIGSNSLLAEDGRSIDENYLRGVAHQVATLINDYDMRVVLVSSGACAVGVNTMGLPEKPDVVAERQALSAIGQIHIITKWERAFAPYNLRCAQLLLTHKDFEIRNSCKNLTDTLKVLFKWKIVPIVNENDPIATLELTVGDNDRLASLLSTQLIAKDLLLLTDINGLYDADPRFNRDAKKLDVVQAVTPEMLDAAGGPGKKGRGGMRSKLESARFAAASGVCVRIANSREEDVILRSLTEDTTIGTKIMPVEWDPASSPVDTVMDEHRRWVACRQVRGTVMIKDEAVGNVFDRQPLCADAVTELDKDIKAGDAVAIVDTHGYELGRGVVQHGAMSYNTDAPQTGGVFIDGKDMAVLAHPCTQHP